MMTEKRCPACAEPVLAEAVKCRWCGEALVVAPPPAPLPSNDEEHLRILSICHYVSAALTAFLACLPLLHVGLGLALVFAPDSFASSHGHQKPPAWAGILIAVVGAFFVLAGWTVAILKVIAGRSLARHRRRTYCLVVACICCLLPPLGTLLGVFTLVVLSRPSVKALFEA